MSEARGDTPEHILEQETAAGALHGAPGAAPQWQVLVWAGRVSVCAYRPATLDAVTRSEGAWGCRRSIHRELMYWPFFRAYSWKTPISTNPNFRCRATDALLGMAMPARTVCTGSSSRRSNS